MTDADGCALPRTCYPTVWIWPGHALYAGPALDLAPHSGSVWCLAVGVDGPITVRGAGEEQTVRSALIPPRLTHQLVCHGGRMVFCYLDPSSDHAESVIRQMVRQHAKIGAQHGREALLIAGARALCTHGSDAAAGRWLELAAPTTARHIDPRIDEVIRRIRERPADTASARELAAGVALSESRFLHLFRAATGTSLRRYRLWHRFLFAATYLTDGQTLTAAAAAAGFASPSHLADRFRATFGLAATQLLGTGVTLRPLGSEVLCRDEWER
ncbi:AraC family transcriptional regulator [Nocardia arthritidis]|uniref:Helix-turn-helix domain-containing protein n=1 Tax=Nocardia arthritidis TaxID=228602 RepID=A0A6G9Y8A9_9NOCA|nr:AraC family transcriptional regulator [Nocardia arthritidis]QIS09495.1 helix-turn-helix domain-containing protein [Nocardia arthritidis]